MTAYNLDLPPPQVTSGEKTAATETALRSFSPKDIDDMAGVGGLTQSAETITTADVTGAANTHYICTIAGLTADRNLTLPAGGSTGDMIRVTVLDGDADYELILKGAATVTINGGSAATEWSRVFIANETVLFEATSSTNWQVVDDGRIACVTKVGAASSNTAWTSGPGTTPDWDTIVLDNADAGSLTGSPITARRQGIFDIRAFATSDADFSTTESVDPGVVNLYYGASAASNVYLRTALVMAFSVASRIAFGASSIVEQSAGHEFDVAFTQITGTNTNFNTNADQVYILVREIL